MGLSHMQILAYARLVTLTTLSPMKSMSWKQLLTICAIHDQIIFSRPVPPAQPTVRCLKRRQTSYSTCFSIEGSGAYHFFLVKDFILLTLL